MKDFQDWRSDGPSEIDTIYQIPPLAALDLAFEPIVEERNASDEIPLPWWFPSPASFPTDTAAYLPVPQAGDGFGYESSASAEANIETWFQLGEFNLLSAEEVSKDEPSKSVSGACSQSLCYGMIHRTRARLVGSMQDHLLSVDRERTVRSDSCYVLSTAYLDAQLHVVLADGARLALMNQKINSAFQDQGINSKIILQAVILRSHLQRALRAASKATDAPLDVDINVYGSTENRQEVGEYLGERKIWLQQPDWYEAGSQYDNPHLLDLSHTQVSKGTETLSEINENSASGEISLDGIVSGLYANLTRATHLERTAGDLRLASQLMPHQEEALHFMLERENGPVPEEYRLWKPLDSESTPVHRHAITGTKSYKIPREIGGGILADEMGMGKTFSMLALIVRTSYEAYRWSIDPDSSLDEYVETSLSKATLIIVPSPLILNNWLVELKSRVGMQELSTFVHHGASRPTDPSYLVDHDIVLTTYQTLVSERNRGGGLLQKIGWFRVVLDEAHFIRRSSTKFHRAVSELEARSRWCLTGTPIQNHLDDIGALFAFLRVVPFDRLGMFRKHISLPYHEGKAKRAACQENLRMLIDCVCLRRDRSLLSLDNVEETESLVDFSNVEHQQYLKTSADLKSYMELHPSHAADENRFGMFQAQLHLRLICNHGTYQRSFELNSMVDQLDFREDMMNRATVDGELQCDICGQFIRLLDANDLVRVKSYLCRHTVCDDCRGQDNSGNSQCRKCKALHESANSLPGAVSTSRGKQTSRFRSTGVSSKISTLMKDLSGLAPEDKSIVFSCWTSTLNLLQQHLVQEHIKFCRIDGDLPLKDREAVLERFSTDHGIKVLIMTTGVGGFGINLVAANRVFLFEPQWNPSVEAQAVGRTLRIGQSRKVKVTRYLIRGTIEEDIRRLQQNKTKTARMAGAEVRVGGDDPKEF